MKRFTETSKWDDPWFRKLSLKHKVFWQYLCDKCDNAGVWKIDFELASFQVGETVSDEDLKYLNNGKERVIVENKRVIVVEFIPFQIGNLASKKHTNLQRNCLNLLQY